LVVITSASDCLERLVPEMIYYVSKRGTLNSTHSLYSLSRALKLYWGLWWPNIIKLLHNAVYTGHFASTSEFYNCCELYFPPAVYRYFFLVHVSLGEDSCQARSIGALTALGRTDWAKVRSDYLTSGVNKQSLDALESAIFHVSLLLHI